MSGHRPVVSAMSATLFFGEGERKGSGRGTGYAVLDIDVFARFLQFFERGDEGVDVGVC